jgi:hypothetical protein
MRRTWSAMLMFAHPSALAAFRGSSFPQNNLQAAATCTLCSAALQRHGKRAIAPSSVACPKQRRFTGPRTAPRLQKGQKQPCPCKKERSGQRLVQALVAVQGVPSRVFTPAPRPNPFHRRAS